MVAKWFSGIRGESENRTVVQVAGVQRSRSVRLGFEPAACRSRPGAEAMVPADA